MSKAMQQVTHTSLFAQMAAIVEAPGYRFLTHYKQDLYGNENIGGDVQHLALNWHPNARFIWVVRETGCNLINLGVHPKLIELAEATISGAKSGSSHGFEIYLVSTKGVRKITEAQAQTEIARLDYKVLKSAGDFLGVANNAGKTLVTAVLRRTPGMEKGLQSKVDYGTRDGVYLSLGDKMALLQIAQCEAIAAWQSLFARTPTVTLNGEDLTEVIAKERPKEAPEQVEPEVEGALL